MNIVRTEAGRAKDSARIVWLAAAVLLAMGRLYPFDRFPLVVCPLKAITHIPCPGCGMTRAFVRFTHGDWAGAVHVSPLGAVLAALAVGLVLYGLLRLTVLRRELDVSLSPMEATVGRVALLGVLLANWVYLIASGAAA